MPLCSKRENYLMWRSSFPRQVADFEKQIGEDPVEASMRMEDEESDEYLAGRLEELQRAIASSNFSVDGMNFFVALALVVEAGGKQMGMHLDGPEASLSMEVAKNKEQYAGLTKECMCKYGATKAMEPEARLLLTALSNLSTVHAQNAEALRLAKAARSNSDVSPGRSGTLAAGNPATAAVHPDQQRGARPDNVSQP